MNRFIFLLVSSSCCFGYQSLNVPPNASVKVTIPNAAPFASQGDYRIEFRLHDWTLPSSGNAKIFSLGRINAYLNSSGQLCASNTGDVMSWGSAVCVSVLGLTDVVARAQRMGAAFPVHDPMAGSTWLEVQDLTTGKVLPYFCVNWASGCPVGPANNVSVVGASGGLGASTIGFSLAWLKWFSTTVAPGSQFDNETAPADLADWRFEGNYDNQGTGGYAVRLNLASGSPKFTGSPVRPPACNLPRQILRAGNQSQLNNNAYPLDGGSTLQYSWQQQSGPTQLIWTGQSTSQPSVTGGVFGSYTIQLTVTDGSGAVSSCSVKDGFVATDANGVVVSANPAVDILLGPQIQLGKNPWAWFDDRHVAEANLQTANLSKYYNLGGTAPWNSAGPGSIAVTTKSAIVTGTGTAFTTTFCQGPANPTVPKSPAAYISVWYPLPAVREGFGRRFMAVASCQSDTQLTLARAWNDQGFLMAGSGWNYAFVDGNIVNTWSANVAPANFYDVAAALYALYYRSGIDDYLDAARLFADAFWQFRHDSGRNFFYGEGFNTFPRNHALLGMVLRALDGRPDMWSGLEIIATYQRSYYHSQFQAYGDWKQLPGDPRENGYALMEEAFCALFDPNASAAAACRSGLQEFMNRGWTPARFPDGNWYSLYWGGSGGGAGWQTYAGWASGTAISLTNGSSTGTCVSLKGTCNWTPNLFTNGSIPQVWWFLDSTASAPKSNAEGDPVTYYPSYVDATHITLKDINGREIGYQGTTGTHGYAIGSIAVQVGYGVQPYMMGILATAFDFVAKAMACTGSAASANCDDKITANAHAYNVQIANYLQSAGYWPATKGMYYSAGFVNCTPPVSDSNAGCTGGSNAAQARVLNAEALRGVMTAYAFNKDPKLRSFGDTLYTAMWGRPGFSVADGTASDGQYISDYVDGYGYFMYGTPPTGQAHKYFGMGWGIGAGSAWPGYRLGGAHTGTIVSGSVAADLASVAQAASFNLLVTYPTGAITTIHCNASPCSLSFDQALGSPAVQVQYLSASGAVLSTQPYPSALHGAQSLDVAPGRTLKVSIPASSPFTTLGDTRLEFRLHNWSTPAKASTILALGGAAGAPLFSVELTPGNELCGLEGADDLSLNGNRMCADITDSPDVLVRMQRDAAGKRFNYEVRTVANVPLVTYCGLKATASANQFGCPIQALNQVSWAGEGEIGDSASVATVQFAWIKWYSSVVLPGSGSIQEWTPSDLADWRFDGTTDETAAGALPIIQGPASYAPRPVYPPVCTGGSSQTLRAGYPAQLDGSASYPLDAGTNLTYNWQELSGPNGVSWTGSDSAHPAIDRLVFGTYIFQLTVRDGSNQSSTCTVKEGAVASDDNGVVITGNSTLDLLIGPQTRFGTNLWPWFDDRQRAAAELQMRNLDAYYGSYWDTPAPGVVTVTGNSAIVTGAGTTFTTTFCQGPADWSTAKTGARIDVWYPLSGGQSGRREFPVSSCQSDTQLTLDGPWATDVPDGAGFAYSYADPSLTALWTDSADPADFYDNVAAFYILYYRSGIDDYLMAARKLADRFWLSPRIDGGAACQVGSPYCSSPQYLSQLGLVLRALDGRPDMWPGLRAMWARQMQDVGDFAGYGEVEDPAEQGYRLAMLSYCALADPNPDSAASCKTSIAGLFPSVWTPFQGKDSNWPALWYGGNGGALTYSSWDSGSSVSLAAGSTAVVGNGTAWTADLFSNNGSATVWFTGGVGMPADNRAGDADLYTATWVDGTHLNLDRPYAGTTGVHGWALAGSGSPVGWGVQPASLGVLALAFDLSAKAIEDIDPANAALAHNYNVAAVNWIKNGGFWQSAKGLYTQSGQLNCQPPISETNQVCTGGNNPAQARALNAMVLRAAGAAYAYTRDPGLKDFGDLLFSAMYAKPATGGLNPDGTYLSDWDDGSGSYMRGVPPTGDAPKYFGMFFGFGDNSTWPAYRTGGLQPPSTRLLRINTITPPPGSSKIRLTITHPNGSTSQTECGFESCAFTADGRAGRPAVGIEYLSPSNSVIRSVPATISGPPTQQ